jgi:hypothetical protein
MDNPPAYTPTTTDVARLLRARTKDATGVELGDWSAETRPTDTEVADLIDQATGPVLAELGRLEDPADPERYADLLPAARFLVTLGTACLVEKSYYPEQINSDRSAYVHYRDEYAALHDVLVGGDGGDGGGVLPGAGAGYASMWTPSASVVLAGGYGYDVDYWPEPENPANWAHPAQPPREPPEPGDLPVGDEPASGFSAGS